MKKRRRKNGAGGRFLLGPFGYIRRLTEKRRRSGMNAKTDQSQEWRTPRWLLDEVERIVGRKIDLDPCAPADGSNPVGALAFFTEKEDGLEQDWGGEGVHRLVFVNPPYKQATAWLAKMIIETRRYDSLIVFFLCPAFTDQPWYGTAIASAMDEFSIKGRVRFLRPDGTPATSPRFPSTLFGFGSYEPPEGSVVAIRRGVIHPLARVRPGRRS